MTAADILSRALSDLADRPLFWALFWLAFLFVILCSMACFERPKQWLRALIAGGLAVECLWFAGYLG